MENKDELRLKLENLQRNLNDITMQKKTATKDYNDQIKDIKEEIDVTLDLLSTY